MWVSIEMLLQSTTAQELEWNLMYSIRANSHYLDANYSFVCSLLITAFAARDLSVDRLWTSLILPNNASGYLPEAS